MKRKGFPSLFPNHVSYFTPTLRFGVEEVEKRCQGRGKGEEREETGEWGRGEGIDVHAGRAQDGPLTPLAHGEPGASSPDSGLHFSTCLGHPFCQHYLRLLQLTTCHPHISA